MGEVFANAANDAVEAANDPEAAAAAEAEREALLAEYPTESHTESYYDDSLRLRNLYSTDGADLGYLVYRDSFYMVSQEQAAAHVVTYSEDGLTAYVTPAIDPAMLAGKTGIVLLREDVGADVVLVFAEGQTPTLEGNTLVVPLEPTQSIALNQLFSDGHIGYSASAGTMRGAGPLMRAMSANNVLSTQSTTDAQSESSLFSVLVQQNDTAASPAGQLRGADYTPTFHLNPSGTNWKATIDYSSISFDDVGASFDVDIWDLKFDLVVSLALGFDFDVTSTGSSGGRERKEVIGLGVSLGLFSLNYATIFEAEFDGTPVHAKGRMRPSMDMHWNPLFGVSIRDFKTPITLKTLELTNPNRDCNKDVTCYLGTGFTINQSFLSLDVDLWLFEIHIGPLASLNQLSGGGTTYTVRLEKDTYDPSTFSRTEDSVHTCAETGKAGCYHIHAREVSDWNWNAKLDLYFKSWTWNLKDEHKELGEKDYYNSLTHGSGIVEGYCPHLLYRVPLRVWQNMEMSTPVPGMDVSVHNMPAGLTDAELSLAAAKSDANGAATIYLPYKWGYYTYMASGNIDDVTVTGTNTDWIKRGANDTVHIVVNSQDKVSARASITWHADASGLDMPAMENVQLQSRLGGSGEWQKRYNFELWRQGGWEWQIDNLPKYGFADGKATLYEYRIRVVDGDQDWAPVVPDQKGEPYVIHIVGSFGNAAGYTETTHNQKCLVDYAQKVEGNVFVTTITETPVLTIDLTKQWRLLDASKQANAVYLALQQRPEAGWADMAAARGVKDAWVTTRNPVEGTTSDLRDLMTGGILSTSDDISSIQDVPLAVGRVDASNNWTTTFTVPQYQSGVKLRYEAAELDTSAVQGLLANVYDLDARVRVAPFGSYTSVPGEAFRKDDYFNLAANVTNLDKIQGAIGGTVRWEAWSINEFHPPAWVKIHIRKNGAEIEQSPVTLNASDYSGTAEWVWTIADVEMDPDATYTVTEEFPSEADKLNWIPQTQGLNVYNNRGDYQSVQCRIRAIFENGANPGTDTLNVTLKNTDNGSIVKSASLYRANTWGWQDHLGNRDQVRDADGYRLEAPEVAGCVRVYRDPIVTYDMGNVTYTYTVYYARQESMTIDVSTIWANTDSTTAYPDTVSADVYRDSEVIKHVTLTRNAAGQWSTDSITQDGAGQALTRVSSTGHHYLYTVRQTSAAEGFTSEVIQTDEGENRVDFKLKNTWVGPDHVSVAGTVTWVGDEGNTDLRPQTVRLSVVNGNEEYVKTIVVPVSGDGRFEAKYLPARDEKGRTLAYSVVQSHVPYYTTTYAPPSYKEDTHTWATNVTNTLTGLFPLTIKKTIQGVCENEEAYTFEVTKYDEKPDEKSAVLTPTVTITGAHEAQAKLLMEEDGLYLFSVIERKGTNSECVYDKSRKVVLVARVPDDNGKPTYKSWVGEADKDTPTFGSDDSNDLEGTPEQQIFLSYLQNQQSSTAEFINKYPGITVEKTWDIDLEKRDRPNSIQAVVQKKNDQGKWENVKLVELNEDNNWRVNVPLAAGNTSTDEFRVRELKEETALQELLGKARELVKQGDGKYQEFLDSLKASAYWQYLPDEFKNSANQSLDALKSALGATSLQDLYNKLLDKIGLAGAQNRIVYDKGDSDKPSGEDAKTNEVTYHVDAYESVVLGGTEQAHVTKYQVGYKMSKEGEHTSVSITNKAIVEIDVIKRWIHPGVDEKDMPDSAWIVLMCKPKEGALENGKNLASAAGVDLGGVLDYEFPVINPIKGGQDPLTILGKLALGLDLSFIGKLAKALFGIKIPELAIQKVTADGNWRYAFVDSKYSAGIPMEYKGAELSSEIIRQIVKYLTNGTVNSPVSYNPFDGYISIPTKAIRTLAGIEDPEDFIDLSGLKDKALNKAKSLTMDDLQNFGPSTLLDDWHYMANVINIKVDWDDDDEPDDDYTDDLHGKKTWDDQNDKFGLRPATLKVYLLANGTRVKDDDGKDVYAETSATGAWRYTFAGRPKNDEDGNVITYTMEEEAVPGYTGTQSGYDFTNKLEMVDLSFTKRWSDDNDRDGKRPDSIEVRLLADGTEIDRHTVTAADDWTWKIGERPKCNKTGKEVAYTVEETSVPTDYTSQQGEGQSTKPTVLNTHTPSTMDVSVTKVWDDDNDRDGLRPQSITLHLLGNGKGVQDVSLTSGVTSTSFDDVYEYEGGKKIKYTLTEDAVEGYTTTVTGNAADGFVVTNKHVSAKVSIAGTKAWDDDNDRDRKRPDSVTVRLLANGTEVDSTTVSGPDWSFSFANKPKNERGKEITYTVTEDAVDGYTTSISGNAASGFTITNTHKIETVKLRIGKRWEDDDNRDGLRPDRITLQLRNGADGPVLQSYSVTASHDWNGTFVLPKNEEGQEIDYALDEETVPTGYEKSIQKFTGTTSYKQMQVTNTHVPAKVTILGTKVWDDDENRDGIRPTSVTVHLLANGTEVDSATVSGPDWSFSFANKPKYERGKEIAYTVAEDAVDDYTTSISGSAASGFTITNTHKIETVELRIGKHWVDDDNRDGKRPERITLQLRNGEDGPVVQSYSVTTSQDWMGSFVLPKNENGQAIVYTLDEEEVPGYTKKVEAPSYIMGHRYLQVTNTRVPQKTTVSVNKVWNDANNQDNERPTSVTVRLLANGSPAVKNVTADGSSQVVGPLTLSGNDWSGQFTDLPVYSKGKEITYSVVEDAVELYTTSVTRNSETDFTVTNSYTPQKTQVNVYKVWDDWDDRERVRPESVTVHLLADGNDTEKTLTLSESNAWTGTFDNLDKNKNQGQEIIYTVTEDEVAQYTTSIKSGKELFGSDDLKNTFVVINSHETTDVHIHGTKTWVDDGDRDGLRPDSVKVWLLSDGMPIMWQMASGDTDEWTYDFGTWPKVRDGKEVVYTVREDVPDGDGESFEDDPIEGYATSYAPLKVSDDDYTLNITNTHDPQKTQVKVYKVWDDWGDRERVRPTSATVRLLADSEATGKSVTLSEENAWAGTFDSLYKYRDHGQEIAYSVTEDEVDQYTVRVQSVASLFGAFAQPASDESDVLKNTFIVTNTHETTDVLIQGTKHWDDGDDRDGLRPNAVKVWLLSDGMPIMWQIVSGDTDDWTYDFGAWPKVRDGKEVVYTVREDVPDGDGESFEDDPILGYATSYEPLLVTTDDQTSQITYTLNVTNTHEPQKTQVKVYKLWNDDNDRDGKRPANVTVSLAGGGYPTLFQKSLTLNVGNFWQGTFDGLYKYQNHGERINYTVVETQLPSALGYEVPTCHYLMEETGIFAFVTNTREPEEVTIRGTKTWNDGDDEDESRPGTIRVWLVSDGTRIARQEVSADTDWQWEFAHFPRYRNGKEIAYTVEEDGFPGYKPTYSEPIYDEGLHAWTCNITNEHTPGMKYLNVDLIWDDENNQDGRRPDSLDVRLYADGEDTGKTLTLSDDNDWHGVFDELSRWRSTSSSGTREKIEYSVKTVYEPMSNYDQYYEEWTFGSTDVGYVIYAYHEPERLTVQGHKFWDDGNDLDGVRPESVEIALVANGSEVDQRTVTAETLDETGGWGWLFSEIPAYSAGKLIDYTVEERPVEGYKTTTVQPTEGWYEITNTRVTNVDVRKVWDDADDADGLRPKSVTVRLLADGEDTGDSLVLSDENGWKGTFEDVGKYKGEDEVVYAVAEDAVEGYTTSVTGDAKEGFVVTNTHVPDPKPYPKPDPDPDPVTHVITYKLNGGTFQGSSNDIRETYPHGTVISIHAKPVRKGYTFTFWKGSSYQPGDSYTVVEDHTFVAQWKKDSSPKPNPDPGPDPKPNPNPNPQPNTNPKPNPLAYTADRTYPSELWILAACLGLYLIALARRRRRT
ncbi:MAG: Cna B-type domain-containing protein [Coriobacteriales bacterium]|nr:Cna B-type domain-containing protein [Coriobacteriales bacterium]